MNTLEWFGILLRWVHISSVALAVGSLAYARLVLLPSLAGLDAAERRKVSAGLTERFRPYLLIAIAGLLVSGGYNLMTQRGHTHYYHMWFGLKMLLVAHVFATAILVTRSGDVSEARRPRRLTSMLISGLLIILISAYLRRIY